MSNINWELIKVFLAVCNSGSLSAAARGLSVSQPTLSRQIHQLETETELSLFKRTTQGLLLTDEGQALVESANKMYDAAHLFDRQAAGMSLELKGDVRISVNEIVGQYTLAPAIAAFRCEHPAVQVEIVISNQAASLNKREADIALRMFRPRQPDLVARRLPDMQLGFFAHRNYLKQHGKPDSFTSLRGHTVIGFDQDASFIEGASKMGVTVNQKDFAIRTDHLLTQLSLLRAAAGIVITHTRIAQQYPELQQILCDVSLPALEFWCVCHGDVQFNSRIRELMAFLIKWFKEDPYREMMV